MKATAWAVLDAEDNVLYVEQSRTIALAMVDDGCRVVPLVMADLDDVEDDA